MLGEGGAASNNNVKSAGNGIDGGLSTVLRPLHTVANADSEARVSDLSSRRSTRGLLKHRPLDATPEFLPQ